MNNKTAFVMIVVVLVVLVGGFLAVQRKQASFGEKQTPDVSAEPDAAEVSFPAPDGYTIRGTLWKPERLPAPAIILAHQFNSDRHDFDAFVPLLLQSNYAVLTYDIRGFGQSQNGTANISDFPQDVQGATAYLKTQDGIDKERFGIIGASVGANVAFVSSGSIKDIAAAVALSPSNTGARGVLLGNEIKNFAPKNIFVASDEREKPDADFIFGKAADPKEQHVYPGFGHGIGLLRNSEAQNDIVSFLERLLGSTNKASVRGIDSGRGIVLNNQGGNMEGHTPRGFKGMGTGLFAGDNLNQNFPNGDGVQFFLTFDLGAIPSGASVATRTGFKIASATLRSKNLHTQGSPFKDLGALKAEAISYDAFSSALWNREANGPACTFTISPDGSVACAVTDAIQQALDDKLRSAQFRVRFEKAGDGDGSPDLALFYNTDSNKNEPGIFQLEVTLANVSADINNDIRIPVILHIVKHSGLANTARSKDGVLGLFGKSQDIWNQARITFDVTLEEIALDGEMQKAVLQKNFEKLYETIPTDDHSLHVVFVQTLGGSNGIAIAPSLALVADSTTVNDFRATAHEIGHLLGLSHTNTGEERLLFRGANGTELTPEEIRIARNGAKAIRFSGT